MNFSAESLSFAQSSPGFMAKLEISIMDARFPNKSSLILFKLWEGGERTQISVVGEIMTPKSYVPKFMNVTIRSKKDLPQMVKLVLLPWCLCKRTADVME